MSEQRRGDFTLIQSATVSVCAKLTEANTPTSGPHLHNKGHREKNYERNSNRTAFKPTVSFH